MPRKIASRKKAKPSSANGRPMTPPAIRVKPGHSSPSSNEMIVPDTAPTAKRIANAFDQRRARASQTRSPVRRYRPSAISIISGRPTPKTAKLRWKASDVPIWARPAVRWLITMWSTAASAPGTQAVPEHEGGDVVAEVLPGDLVQPGVIAVEDAAVARLPRRRGEARERPLDVRQRRRGRREGEVVAVDRGQDVRARGADRAVR